MTGYLNSTTLYLQDGLVSFIPGSDVPDGRWIRFRRYWHRTGTPFFISQPEVYDSPSPSEFFPFSLERGK